MGANPKDYGKLAQYISIKWDLIRSAAWQGEPYRHIILELEDILRDERALLEEERSEGGSPDFSGLNSVVFVHNHNYSWLDRTLNERSEFVTWWKEHIEKELAELKHSANDSRKLVMLTHGAAMLTSMTALGAIQQNSYVPSFLAVSLGGLFGFMLAVAGQIIWLESYGDTITTLRADFKSSKKIIRFRAYGRYMKKRWNGEVVWSIRLTYASVVVFPIYSVLAIALAFNK